MGLFEKFSLPISFTKKKTLGISAPVESPILGQTMPYKTIATFDLKVEKPYMLAIYQKLLLNFIH